MNVYEWEDGKWKGLLMDGGAKNQPRHIIWVFDLTALNLMAS